MKFSCLQVVMPTGHSKVGLCFFSSHKQPYCCLCEEKKRDSTTKVPSEKSHLNTFYFGISESEAFLVTSRSSKVVCVKVEKF